MTDGLAKLKAIIADFPADSGHWNEAQNRFQFIDRLMIECLGWEHPNMEVERRDADGGKADYVLGVPARAVLEAKREAVRFDLLPSGRPSAVRKLRPLVEACANFKSAVLQVISYCSLLGAQMAGDVGVGKTSFFENLFEQIEDKYKDDTFFIHINLGVKATMTDDIKTFVIDEIARVLKEDFQTDVHSGAFVDAV